MKDKEIRRIATNSWVIKKLQKCEKNLSVILADDEKLYRTIVEGCLLVGKIHPSNDCIVCEDNIKKLVWDKYPDLYTNVELAEKREVFNIIYHLISLIKGHHILVKIGLKKFFDQDYKVFYSDIYPKYREVIEEQIIKTFYPGEIESNDKIQDKKESPADIIGEIIEQTDGIEL